ncbi:hypothetical protein ACE6H2_011145 [Prunus campanulata]
MAMEFLKLGFFLDVPQHILIGIDTQFIGVIYYQLKHGLHKDCTDMSSGSSLLDDSWFSADSFLLCLFKVIVD